MPSIKEVAALAGVSKSTVSNVFVGGVPVRDATRRKVLAAAEALRYRPHAPAQTLRTGRSKVIGLCVFFVTGPAIAGVIQGATQEAYGKGYSVFICALDSDADLERTHVNLLLGQRAAAVVSYASSDDPSGYLELQRAGTPVVFVGSRPPGIEADLIMPDYREAVFAATSGLLASGRHRIGLLTGPLQRVTSVAGLEGYREAHAAADVPLPEGLVIASIRNSTDARAAAAELLARGIDALVAGLPSLSFGAVACLLDRGVRVPEDVAFIGSGDIGWARLVRPPLTMIGMDAEELGRRAMALALERLDPRTEGLPARTVLLPLRLAVRASSDPVVRAEAPVTP